MYMKFLRAGLRVTHQLVSEALKLIDPEGVDQRRRRRLIRRRYYAKGSNSVWHIDSYDKLKPFGIAINGCVDGFSRFVIWARASYTNNDPKVIAGYYLDAIQELHCCPQKVRVDAGTENVNLKTLHEVLRNDDNGAIVGRSTANVRIESWWGQYRRGGAEYYIALFNLIQSDGDFVGDFVDKELVRFCFLRVIQVPSGVL